MCLEYCVFFYEPWRCWNSSSKPVKEARVNRLSVDMCTDISILCCQVYREIDGGKQRPTHAIIEQKGQQQWNWVVNRIFNITYLHTMTNINIKLYLYMCVCVYIWWFILFDRYMSMKFDPFTSINIMVTNLWEKKWSQITNRH